MKREILFRGKRLSDGKWLYGYLNEAVSAIKVDGKVTKLRINRSFVDPDTIGQYTGLKDKEGNRIFDDDILSLGGKRLGLVVGDVRGYCYDVEYIPPLENGEKRCTLWGTHHTDYRGDVKIVGNRFDNPELLKYEQPKPEWPKNGLLEGEFRIRALYDNGCMSEKGHVYIAERVKVDRKEKLRVWAESSRLDDAGTRRFGTYINMDLSILGNDKVYPNYEIVEDNQV